MVWISLLDSSWFPALIKNRCYPNRLDRSYAKLFTLGKHPTGKPLCGRKLQGFVHREMAFVTWNFCFADTVNHLGRYPFGH